jgi:hypothetical protein
MHVKPAEAFASTGAGASAYHPAGGLDGLVGQHRHKRAAGEIIVR